MENRSDVTLYLAIFLLICQVFVFIALMVVVKQYRSLKKTFEDHKASFHLQSTRRPTGDKEKNQYIEGTRDSSTLVRTSSKESVVWVPTPIPKRRNPSQEPSSAELNMTQMTSVAIDCSTTTDGRNQDDIEQQHLQNVGYEPEEDEIYDNQEIINMQARDTKQPEVVFHQSNINEPEDDNITCETHATSAPEDSSKDTEPIYENLRGRAVHYLQQA